MEQRLSKIWYDQYSVPIYRYALSILKNKEDAEDVLQETFIRLLTAKTFRLEPGKETAWLFTTARNLAYDILRQRKKKADAAPENGKEDDDIRYLELIAVLSPIDQEIVSLKVIGRLTHKEIAAVLHLTAHGVSRRYERALKKLREAIKEEEGWKRY